MQAYAEWLTILGVLRLGGWRAWGSIFCFGAVESLGHRDCEAGDVCELVLGIAAPRYVPSLLDLLLGFSECLESFFGQVSKVGSPEPLSSGGFS